MNIFDLILVIFTPGFLSIASTKIDNSYTQLYNVCKFNNWNVQWTCRRVGTHMNADCLLENIKHSEYVNQKLNHFDNNSFRQLFVRIGLFFVQNDICPFLKAKHSYIRWPCLFCETKVNECLIRGWNCLPFASTWVHSWFLAGSLLLIIFVCVFVFILCAQCCQLLWIVVFSTISFYFLFSLELGILVLRREKSNC